MDSRRPLAQITTIFLVALAAVFCLCGGLITVSALLSGDPIFLPSGEEANADSLLGVLLITLCICGLFAFILLLAGAAVWYLFGQEKAVENVRVKAIALFLFLGSLFFAFWAVLVVATGSLTNGMHPITGEELGWIPSLMGALVCLVPAVLLACASLAVWFFFIKGQPRSIENVPNNKVDSVESYISFIQSLLPQLQHNDADASIQARTAVTLKNATVEEKRKVLLFLYEAGLVNTMSPNISLYGLDFTRINLATLHLPNINLAGSDLSHANLHQANLTGAIFQETILIDADLRFTDLASADLQNSDLRDARLHGSHLHKANLHAANLTGANFWQADLTGALVTELQLKTVKSLLEATLPDGSKV